VFDDKKHARRRLWRKKNADKVNAYQRAWNLAHREDLRAYQAQYRSDNRDRVNASKQAWKERNPEKVREINRTSKALHPETGVTAEANRRARLRGNGGSHTSVQWRALKASFNNRCLSCGRSEDELKQLGLKIVRDHVLPIKSGGTGDISNIQPLCHGIGGCNLLKGTKHIDYRIPEVLCQTASAQ
jgi:hypothetical protein